jgi:hypothetical protein
MLACGTGAFVTYYETEYIPLYTVNMDTRTKTPHTAEYLYNTGTADLAVKFKNCRGQ